MQSDEFIMTKETTQWYASWFDTPYYHILYKDRNHAEAHLFMDNLTNYLNLPEDGKILDLACGRGRHSIYLNSLGSETFDPFWLFITKQFNWIPLFAIIMYLAFKRLGWRHAVLVIFVVALLITVTDQTTNFIKNSFQRLRPGNNPEISEFIRAVQKRKSFSFISGHASNSMAVAFLLFNVLRPYLKYTGLFFIWPLIFAYSRIYLGLHYPGDILVGYMWGILTGYLALKLYVYLRDRFFPEKKEDLDNPTNSEPVSNG